MLIVDIETTSLDRNKAEIINLGAIDVETGDELFIECRPTASQYLLHQIGLDSFDSETTNIHGVDKELWFLRRELNDDSFFNQREAIEILIDFADRRNTALLAGWNIGQFDFLILCRVFTGNMNLDWYFGHRCVDLASICYHQFGEFLGSKDIAKKLGIKPEGIHTGITGARLEYEVWKKLQ